MLWYQALKQYLLFCLDHHQSNLPSAACCRPRGRHSREWRAPTHGGIRKGVLRFSVEVPYLEPLTLRNGPCWGEESRWVGGVVSKRAIRVLLNYHKRYMSHISPFDPAFRSREYIMSPIDIKHGYVVSHTPRIIGPRGIRQLHVAVN